MIVEFENPVKEAAKLAVKRNGPTNQEIDAEIERLTQMSNRLLPVEQGMKAVVKQSVDKLAHLKIDKLFPRLDMSFLQWRRKRDGWPAFAFFSPTEMNCYFQTTYADRRWEADKMVPDVKAFAPHFKDIWQKLKDLGDTNANSRFNKTLSAQFNGILPDEIRDQIKQFTPTTDKPSVFDSVYIVTEAPEWRVDYTILPQKVDPLLIGRKDEGCWLIAAFDLTPAEALVKAEWLA